ncbi:Bug family tripartite tricarboxylate transporter substrate binding protein [Alicycliphilus sp. T452]
MSFVQKLLTAISIATLTAAGAPALASADFPSKPIKVVVPYAAGGTIDAMARVLSPKLQAILGKSVVVDNRPGAGTVVGADAVARAEPDGHTLFMGSNAAFTISPQVMDKVPYDPIRSFAAIGTLASFPNLILVRPDSPYKTLADVVHAAKTGTNVNYASFGIGSTAQLSGEAIKVASGAGSITEIPYKSGALCVQAVLAGEVTFGFDTAIGAVQRVKQGQVRALAVTSAARMPDLPDVQTVVEAGYPNAEVIAWIGVFVPAATPAPIQGKLAATLQRVMADADVKKQFANLGVQVKFVDGETTMSSLRSEYVRFGRLIEAANIRVK